MLRSADTATMGERQIVNIFPGPKVGDFQED